MISFVSRQTNFFASFLPIVLYNIVLNPNVAKTGGPQSQGV